MSRRKQGNRPRPGDFILPEMLTRESIDRPIDASNGLFTKAFGWRNAPIQTAADVVLAKGSANLLGVGCGTGNELRTWKREAKLLAPAAGSISITGVNKCDYSRESMHRATIAATESGELRYVVADAVDMPLEDDSMDVALAYTAVEFAEDPVAWVKEMARVTRGVLFFTADLYKQYQPGYPLFNSIDRMNLGDRLMVKTAHISTNIGHVVNMALVRIEMSGAAVSNML